MPVVIGTWGTVTKHFEKWIEKFGIDDWSLDLELTIEALQKPCLLGAARIIRLNVFKNKSVKKIRLKVFEYEMRTKRSCNT